MKKSIIYIILCCAVFLVSCSSSTNSSSTPVDILTQKKYDPTKTQISVLVKYAFNVDAFEEAIEEQFPDIDIVQVGNYTANTALAKEYETRLQHNDLTDIVMTWPLDVGGEYWEDRLLDLSGMPFTSRYMPSTLSNLLVNDKLYYLPGPAGIRGIVYNKTLFEEHGWEVPSDYEGFLALCKKIDATGIRAFELGLGNEEVRDTAFVGFSIGNSFSKPKDMEWLYNYNEKQIGNFGEHFETALDTFQELIDEKIIRPEDLNKFYHDTQTNLFTRKTAMVEDSSLLTSMATGSDEFALMPFFSKNPNNDWARVFMLCYIGLNKHLEDDPVKYEKVMNIMDYISTPEGQVALAGNNGYMFSSLAEPNGTPSKELEPLLPALSQGRYIEFPTLKNGQSAFRKAISDVLQGVISVDEVGPIVDEANTQPKVVEHGKILGKAEKDFTMIETGGFVCDTLKEVADTDLALFLDNGKDGLYNGKGISAKLYEGDIYEDDLQRIFPDLKHGEKGELWKIQIRGDNLIKALEYSMSIDGRSGWFYYFSGLTMKYNPSDTPGKRIKNIVLSDGSKLNLDQIYSVAVMEDSIALEYIESIEKSGILIQDILKNKIIENKTISPIEDKRFLLK